MRIAPLLLTLPLAACSAFQPSSSPFIATGNNSFSTLEAAQVQERKNATNPVGEPTLKPAPVDKSRQLQTVEIIVDQSDPNSMRQLAPLILKPDQWMLVQREPLTPTSFRFRFKRLISAEGKAIPEIDPLNPPKRAPQ